MLPRRQKTRFLDIRSDVHVTFYAFMFSSGSVKSSVKMTFWYLITCYKYSIRLFSKEISPNRNLNTQMFPSVVFPYSFKSI